ncbi:MAG: hypothetical protein HUJ92_04225, partial [Bacteroidales bacterium]|nr:hypothetical protein [Bacteroidales bacterium]
MKRLSFIMLAIFFALFQVGAQEIYSFGRQAAVSPEITDTSIIFRLHAPKARKVMVMPSWLGWGSKPIELKEGKGG